MRMRNCCFTINNYTREDIDLLCEFENVIVYIVAGFEVGEQGTPHIQGYMEFRNEIHFNRIKKGLPRAHIEARKGKNTQAADYCKKEGYFMEHGKLKVQGARNDLDRVRQVAIESGMREITATCNLQQIKVAEKFLTYNEPCRDFKPTVTWITGPTGSGKSRRAREILGPDDVYTKSDVSKWFDGYDAHENVILDDFRGSWMAFSDLLTLLDRYERRVEFKGGCRQFLAKNIVITSIMRPEQCYPNVGEDIQQLLRRIDKQLVLEIPAAEVLQQKSGGNTDTPSYPGW